MKRRAIILKDVEEELPETALYDSAVDQEDWVEDRLEHRVGSNGGRLPLYRKAYDKVARNMRLLGYTNAEIAEVFGIKPTTLQYWRETHPTFYEAWHEGGPIAMGKVVRAMFKSATGFTEDGKYYPPDVGAGKFLLVNKESKLWKNVSSTQLSGPNGTDISLAPSINVLVVQNTRASPPTIDVTPRGDTS